MTVYKNSISGKNNQGGVKELNFTNRTSFKTQALPVCK